VSEVREKYRQQTPSEVSETARRLLEITMDTALTPSTTRTPKLIARFRLRKAMTAVSTDPARCLTSNCQLWPARVIRVFRAAPSLSAPTTLLSLGAPAPQGYRRRGAQADPMERRESNA
jgi:hypothetical protein